MSKMIDELRNEGRIAGLAKGRIEGAIITLKGLGHSVDQIVPVFNGLI